LKLSQHNVYVTLGASNHSDEIREQNDYYATDPKAVRLLLEREQFSPTVWECACGQGHLSAELARGVRGSQLRYNKQGLQRN